MFGALDLEVQFVDENRYFYSLGHEFLDESRYSYSLGHEVLDENKYPYSLGHEFFDEIIKCCFWLLLAAPGCYFLFVFFLEPVWLDPALSSYFSGTRIFSSTCRALLLKQRFR